MAHISGTYSSPDAGILSVSLSGTFFYGTRRDAGFPGGTNSNADKVNYAVRAYIGPSGSLTRSQPIDRFAPHYSFLISYPGSNTVWQVGTETLAYVDPIAPPGIWSYGFYDLRIELILLKR